MQIGDWLDDLAEFPAQDVATACAEWRQTQQRRPIAYEIRVLAIAEQRRREPRKPPSLMVTDMHREPIPAADVVRDGWAKIPRSLLTAAELALMDQRVPVAMQQALAAVGARAVHAIPVAAGEARRRPSIERHELVAEDDPAMLDQLREMGL